MSTALTWTRPTDKEQRQNNSNDLAKFIGDASGLMWAKKRDAMTTAAAPGARLWADRVPDAVMSTNPQQHQQPQIGGERQQHEVSNDRLPADSGLACLGMRGDVKPRPLHGPVEPTAAAA